MHKFRLTLKNTTNAYYITTITSLGRAKHFSNNYYYPGSRYVIPQNVHFQISNYTPPPYHKKYTKFTHPISPPTSSNLTNNTKSIYQKTNPSLFHIQHNTTSSSHHPSKPSVKPNIPIEPLSKIIEKTNFHHLYNAKTSITSSKTLAKLIMYHSNYFIK